MMTQGWTKPIAVLLLALQAAWCVLPAGGVVCLGLTPCRVHESVQDPKTDESCCIGCCCNEPSSEQDVETPAAGLAVDPADSDSDRDAHRQTDRWSLMRRLWVARDCEQDCNCCVRLPACRVFQAPCLESANRELARTLREMSLTKSWSAPASTWDPQPHVARPTGWAVRSGRSMPPDCRPEFLLASTRLMV